MSDLKREPEEVWAVIGPTGNIIAAHATREEAEKFTKMSSWHLGKTCTYCRYVVPAEPEQAPLAKQFMVSDSKQPGQRAHDVYYSALDGAARLWEMGLNRERYAWAAVEQAFAVPAEPEPRIKSQLAHLHQLGCRIVTPDGHTFALLDESLDMIACETNWQEGDGG